MRTCVLIFLSLSLLFAACFAQTRPTIPSTFHARVSAVLYSGSESWTGYGLYAMDIATGFARTDIHLWLNDETRMNIHTLDRYDMKSSFVYDNENNECQRKPVSGSMENPLDWVAKSTFVSESELRGDVMQTWEYKEGTKQYSVSVKKGTNEPVIFSTKETVDGIETEIVYEVRSWSTEASAEWARYVPRVCTDQGAVGDVPGVVYFANNNWDCADVNCSVTVPAGTGQPNYGCAEFVARCLAYGGFIPNISATASQGDYYGYNYNGNSYDLCYTTYLSECLGVLGFTKLAAAYSSVNAGVAVFGDAGDGYFSHAIIGVGSQTIDAHNNARYQIAVQDDMINGVDAAWGCPGTPSSSYYAAQMEASQYPANEGGAGAMYNKAPDSADNELRLMEEKPAQKF